MAFMGLFMRLLPACAIVITVIVISIAAYIVFAYAMRGSVEVTAQTTKSTADWLEEKLPEDDKNADQKSDNQVK